jgi:hypothetical protein
MKQKGFTLIEMIICIIVLFGGGGWIANIWKIFQVLLDPLMTLGTIPALCIFRIIGVFMFPLGAILGYF